MVSYFKFIRYCYTFYEIKQQVGWNFWQSKNAMWVNQELVKYKIKAI